MSFALGNTRSANRGSCAQPCRLEYKNGYLLSLKDQCLAMHIKKIIQLAPASLKIEGRMKRPEYVYNATKIYRECLDGRRNATEREIEQLAKVFSRQGFADGYFKRNLGMHMYGVRTEKNKEDTYNFTSDFTQNAELGMTAVKKMRHVAPCEFKCPPQKIKNINMNPKLTLVFASFGQFSGVAEYLKEDEIFKRIYRIFVPLPVSGVPENFRDITGIRMPAVIFDNEKDYISRKLAQAAKAGIKYALADNIGHINIAREAGFKLFGNAGLNIANTRSLEEYKKLGFKDALLSPELKFAQMRDISKRINAGIVAYGRISVLISENCFIKNAGVCKSEQACGFCGYKGRFDITDKTGAGFPVAGDFGHRNIVYNSAPVYLADKRELYKKLGLFFISLNFTRESPGEIRKIISEYIGLREPVPPKRFTRGYK